MISGPDLETWSNTNQREAQGTLAELIRRLIHAVSHDLRKVDIPAGDGVSRPGWDGIIDTKEGNAWVPQNLSVWEMGTSKDVSEKANTDYKNRLANSAGIDKKKATFVFVSSRRWDKKREWEEKKRKCGDWADVKVYDADDLEQWLCYAPAVNAWFSGLINKREPGAIAIEDWWRGYSASTTPEILPGLLVASRQDAVSSMVNWLHQSDSNPLRIKGETSEEALAFIASVLVGLPLDEQKHYFSRIILIKSNTDIELALNVKSPHIYILIDSDGVALGRILSCGHRAVIPVGRDARVRPDDIFLPRQSREAFEAALKTMGIDSVRAERLRHETGRSLSVLRRRLALEKTFENPAWLKSSLVSAAKAALLAGAWDENKAEDKKILEVLSGHEYASLAAEMKALLNTSDAPIRKEGSVWKLVSPMDAWGLLARLLTAEDLARYEKAVNSTLSVKDPRLEVAPANRYAASIYGKVPLYSEWLRNGLSENLVLLAIADDQDLNLGYLCQDKVDAIVRGLLHATSSERWYSLSSELPVLAEAAPKVFLNSLEDSIASAGAPVLTLFQEEGDMGACHHSGLLWGLEGLAWNSELFPHVAEVLAALSEKDPGGRYGNRPLNSLKEIFLSWIRYTSATDVQRLDVFKGLIKRHPQIGWKLLLLILPDSPHSTSSPIHKPIGRVWALDVDINVTELERHEFIVSMYKEAFIVLSDIAERYRDILLRYHMVPSELRDTFMKLFREYVGNCKDLHAREYLRSELRGFLHRCRQFSDSAWNLPKGELDAFEEILSSLEPTDVVARFGWLFESSWPELLGGEVEDFKTQEARIKDERKLAIKEIYSATGIDGIIRTVSSIKEGQYIIGFYGAEVILDNALEEYVLDVAVKATDIKTANFVTGFVTRLSTTKGKDWIDACLTSGSRRNWTGDCYASFCLCLPHNMETWMRVESLGNDITKKYWERVNFVRCENEADFPYAVEQLLAVNKPINAIHSLRVTDADKIPATLLLRLLHEAGQTIDSMNESGVLSGISYEIEEILLALDLMPLSDAERDQLVLLEFQFLEVFRGDKKGPKEIVRRLKNNPGFFVQVASWGFRSNKPEVMEKEAKEIPADRRDGLAKQSWNLLKLCKSLPGSLEDGRIDGEVLRKWVLDARERFEAVGRKEVGDVLIGNVLASAPPDPDGAWPVCVVRDLIEEVKSTDLERGINTQIYNNRGIFSRAIGEGGTQERSLKDRYTTYANKVMSQWPRTGRMLKAMADSYEQDAHRVDIEARQDELKWD